MITFEKLRAVVLIVSFVWLLAGCVNLNEKVSFSLVSYGDKTTLDVSKAKLGFHANPHGGNSDGYQFIVPRNIKQINVDQVYSYYVNYREQSPKILGSGALTIKTDKDLCELTIAIFNEKSVPHPLNGTYSQKYCGQ